MQLLYFFPRKQWDIIAPRVYLKSDKELLDETDQTFTSIIQNQHRDVCCHGWWWELAVSGHTASYYNQKRVLMIMFLIQVVEFPFPSRPSNIKLVKRPLNYPKKPNAWPVPIWRGVVRRCPWCWTFLHQWVRRSVSHSFTPDEKKNSPSRNVLALTGLSEAIGKQRVETTPELGVGDEL